MNLKSAYPILPNIIKLLHNVKGIIKIFPKKYLPGFYYIQFLIIIGTFLESVSIFSIMPFLASFDSNSDNNIITLFGINNLDRSVLFLIFIFFLIASNIFQALLNYKIIKFGYDVTGSPATYSRGGGGAGGYRGSGYGPACLQGSTPRVAQPLALCSGVAFVANLRSSAGLECAT